MSSKAVLAQALQLPPQDRADIAKCLIESLDGPPDEGVEESWITEVERRLQASDEGRASVEPWEDVRARIAARLRAKRA